MLDWVRVLKRSPRRRSKEVMHIHIRRPGIELHSACGTETDTCMSMNCFEMGGFLIISPKTED
jgi:hypothetical protein